MDLAYTPLFLGLRFLLELVELGCYAVWGWRKVQGPLRLIAAIAVPVAGAMLRGTFATAVDEARSGETTFDTPGPLRQLLELAVLGGAWARAAAPPRHSGGRCYLIVLVVYHVGAYGRIWWLLLTCRDLPKIGELHTAYFDEPGVWEGARQSVCTAADLTGSPPGRGLRSWRMWAWLVAMHTTFEP